VFSYLGGHGLIEELILAMDLDTVGFFDYCAADLSFSSAGRWNGAKLL